MRRGAQNGDDNWNTFAELGIGLNPKITDLTGNSLFDEKAIKTLHIAIGDNSVFGDDISSFIHADLVTRRPSLVLDGHVVMDRGVIDHAAIQQRRTAFIPSDGMETMDAVIHLSSPW
jgi:leucyl aminopeptidase (aminopeptidase T)